ncbi:holo-ACP synthase [Ramlibacter sp. MMS24-I3-19]|uniref:holo-ACP synthase n=1 Tax=Ramlibacter sp. MMS24-I3-19 TaxID=3416606 RepID=UPI003D08A832
MHSQNLIQSLSSQWPATLPGVVRLGIDLVHVPRIAESLRDFGDRFAQRLFTDAEIAYARSSGSEQAARFAARFAAKEATIKTLSLSDAGVNWRDMEVQRAADGACSLVLRGEALAAARSMGVGRLLVSLSHDGDYAAAVVAALSDTDEPHR